MIGSTTQDGRRHFVHRLWQLIGHQPDQGCPLWASTVKNFSLMTTAFACLDVHFDLWKSKASSNGRTDSKMAHLHGLDFWLHNCVLPSGGLREKPQFFVGSPLMKMDVSNVSVTRDRCSH